MTRSQIFWRNIIGKHFHFIFKRNDTSSDFLVEHYRYVNFGSIANVKIMEKDASNNCRGYVPEAGQGWFLISLLVSSLFVIKLRIFHLEL